MFLVGDIHLEIMPRRMMAEVRTPVSAGHFPEFGPALEGGGREMIDDQAFAASHKIEQRIVRSLPPAKVRLLFLVIVEDHDIVRRERLGSAAAELLDDVDFEAIGVLEQRSEYRRGAAPVVSILSGDDECL